MTLNADVPEPPSLRGPQATDDYEAVDQADEPVHDDYRREELSSFLENGAWAAAFDEWAAHTLVTQAQFEAMTDLRLVEKLDFYWEPSTGDVGFRAPSVPDDLPAEVTSRIDDEDVVDIEEGLAELGRTVSEQLEAEIGRDSSDFGFFAAESPDVEPGGQ